MKGFPPAYYNQLVMGTLLYNAGLGRPKVKLELRPLAIYNYVMEKGVLVLNFFLSPTSQ